MKFIFKSSIKINPMIKKSLFLICVLFTLKSSAQNLVPNPSFEDTVSCPTNSGQIDHSNGWSAFNSSPDYFHLCSQTIVSVPNNIGGFQIPHTGNAYAGLYSRISNNQREYIGRNLGSPLQIGTKYFFSMYVSLSSIDSAQGFTCSTNNLGVKFTNMLFNDSSPLQITNNAQIYETTIISDTIGWALISGSFVADSSYSYIVIGNFFDDQNTLTNFFYNDTTYKAAYYFIDDICLSTDSTYSLYWTNLNNYENDVSFNIYPNPTINFFQIDFPSETFYTIEISNSIGEIIYKKNNGSLSSFHYNEILPKGIYIISIIEKNRKTSKKLIIN